MIDHMDLKAEYDFAPRDPMLCPHCGKTGYKYDGYDLKRESAPSCHDDVYLCASCQGEWIMRSYRYPESEQYPGPAGALIYIPVERQR